MSIRKFLTSVADVYAYDTSEQLIFAGKTLLDSSIEVSLGSAPVRGGRGNQLQYIYYHTGEMKFNLTDTQWNLGMLAATVGVSTVTSNSTYQEESVSLTVAGQTVTGTVAGTPLAATSSATLYGWVTLPSGTILNGTFSGSNFTATKAATETLVTGELGCIRYWAADSASVSVKINANMIPKVVKLVMETQLNSADVTTNKIGVVQIIAPTVALSGAFSISMKSDGVSNTPLTATALAYQGTGVDACVDGPYYAKLIEIIDDANWYDNVVALAIQGGDFAALTTADPVTLVVWAIPSSGAAFLAPTTGTELTFSSGTEATATVTANLGVVTMVGAGTTLLKVLITASSTVEASCILTVSAP